MIHLIVLPWCMVKIQARDVESFLWLIVRQGCEAQKSSHKLEIDKISIKTMYHEQMECKEKPHVMSSCMIFDVAIH